MREVHKLVQKLSSTASKQFLLRAYVFIWQGLGGADGNLGRETIGSSGKSRCIFPRFSMQICVTTFPTTQQDPTPKPYLVTVNDLMILGCLTHHINKTVSSTFNVSPGSSVWEPHCPWKPDTRQRLFPGEVMGLSRMRPWFKCWLAVWPWASRLFSGSSSR